MNGPQKVPVFAVGAPPPGTRKERRRYRVKWRIAGTRRGRSRRSKAPALDDAAADAEQYWRSICGPTADQLHSSSGPPDKRSTGSKPGLDRAARFQHPPVSRGIDRDLGISL